MSEHISNNKKIRAVALIVSLLTILVYLPGLNNGFVNWDDDWYVYENSHIRSFGYDSLKWMFTTFHAGNWHPLTWISHAADYAIWELDPTGHHLTSIILHGLNTFFVIILIIRLINYGDYRSETGPDRSGSKQYYIVSGTVTGLLFGLHPLHVESVAWVSGRKDVLYALFFLLSVLSYVKYASSSLQKPGKSLYHSLNREWSKGIYYCLCLLFFMCSLMSKPMAVTLPFVLLILDIYPLRRFSFPALEETRSLPRLAARRSALTDKIPFIGLSIASSVVTVLAQHAGGAIKPLSSYPLWERILVGIRALGFYLVKIVWPTDLYPFYHYPLKISLLSPEYLLAFISVICTALFSILSWKKQKIFAVTWLYYGVTLLPVLGIIQVGEQAAADRYTYLPALGPFLLIALGIAYIRGLINKQRSSIPKKLFFPVVMIVLVLSLFVITTGQIKKWENPETLWDIETRMQRGRSYAEAGDYYKAIENFNVAVMVYPDYAEAYGDRGITYLKMGDYQQALQDLNRSIEINPQNERAHRYRNSAYKLAIHDYSRSIIEDPRDYESYNNRGISYAMTDQYDKALEDFNKVISLKPRFAMAYYNRGLVYMKLGNKQKTDDDFRTAARLGYDRARDYLK